MWLLIAFILVPLVEIGLFIQVGGWIGLWPTLAIVVLTAVLGTWLVRAQGMSAMNNLRSSFSQLEDPSEPLAHGAMILIAAVLLLTPGFFTDALGFSLLVPKIRSFVFAQARSRVHVQKFQMGGHPHDQQPHGHNSASDDVIDGQFQEVETPKKPTHRPSGWTKH